MGVFQIKIILTLCSLEYMACLDSGGPNSKSNLQFNIFNMLFRWLVGR